MSKGLISSYSRYTTHAPVDSDRGHLERIASEVEPKTNLAVQPENHRGDPLSSFRGNEPMPLADDRVVAELAIRRLTAEIDQAHSELQELEEVLLEELLKPPARNWLFVLMAIGLALSLYGSLTAVNIAGMIATGLMLLWSLSAFWLIYKGDKQQEKARAAHKAEIEIWSNRIEELQQSLDRHQRILETA